MKFIILSILLIFIVFVFAFSLMDVAKQADEEMDRLHRENMNKIKMNNKWNMEGILWVKM